MADNHHLLMRAKAGDEDARQQLVAENMGLVVSVAKRYTGRGQELEDLIQIGAIGLLKCIDRFDPAYEVKLSTYAVPMIQGEIRRFLRDDGLVKVSRNLKSIYYRAEKYRQEVTKRSGAEPGIDEICAAISETPENVIMAMEAAEESMCINEMNEELSGNFEGDAVIEKLYVEQLLGTLPVGERRVMVMRYFEGKTQGQIGELLGMSQVQVSRLEKKILRQLRESQKLE